MSNTALGDIINQGVGKGAATDQAPAPPPTNNQQYGARNDPTGTPVTPYNHGDGGIFFLPWSNNQLVSTLIMPRGGMIDRIPVLNTDPFEDNTVGNLFGGRNYDYDSIMTGLTEGDIETFANQPTDECAVGPTGGLIKLCTLVNTMGHYRGSIREVALFRAGQVQDRLDEMSHRLINSAQALQEFFGTPDDMPEQNAIIMNEMARRLFELLVPFRRFFSRQIWSGNPTNNNGQARQIMGLDLHVNAGNKVDAFSGALCGAADSIVEDFNYNSVDSSAFDVIEYLEKIEYDNNINANRMGLGPVTGVLVMQEALFYELTNLVPVKQYQAVMNALQQQGNSDDTRIMINATDAQRDRDSFRNNLVLPLNGRLVPVVLDDGIVEENNINQGNLAAGEFASDIYFVPMQVMGGLPATFFQFFNHDNSQAQGILQRVAPNAFTFTSDGGAFRWHINYQNGCLGMNFQFAPWLKLKFPMLAWRLTNVAYRPLRRNRSPFPDSSYFSDGGNIATSSQPTVQQIYPPWSPGTPVNI